MLEGFTALEPLGSGGFSDVFLYRQSMPQRQVAVKVLRARPDSDAGQFVAEANVMAHLSSHPAIVTIYQAALAPDGRPYLMMEYCPRPNLAQRYRTERLSVAEVLRIGVRLSGAVETAHRAGILHRDIKPANVLTNDYGWPALTDFGISVVGEAASSTESGMSIPWAAPEFFADGVPRGPAADVYSLAATLYTVLAGRSPFELVGGSNTAFDLIARLTRDPVPSIGRQDVPAAVEHVLERAMAKRPGQRYASALEFGRALQRVEQELFLAPTHIDVPESLLATRNQGPDGGIGGGETRVRAIVTVDPEQNPEHTLSSGSARWQPESPGSAPLGMMSPTRAASQSSGGDLVQPQGWGPPAEVEVDPGQSAPPSRPATARRARGLISWLIAAAVVIGVVVALVWSNLSGADVAEPTPTPTILEPATAEAPQVVDPPINVTLTRDSQNPENLTLTWDPPAQAPADTTFVYRVVGAASQSIPATSPVELSEHPEAVCVEVKTRSAKGSLSQGIQVCTP